MPVKIVTVHEHHHDQRVDNYLFREYKNVPKSRIYRAIRGGEVRVNKKRVKAHSKLKAGDILRIPPLFQDEKAEVRPSRSLCDSLEDTIIYEDNHLILINKPAGVPVHGGTGVKAGLIEALRYLRPKNDFLELVHRLDRDTSGCMLIAKKPGVLKDLHRQLADRKVVKQYLLLVYGEWKREGWVRAPLLKNHLQSGERVVTVSDEGKEAETYFKPLKRIGNYTLVTAFPKTGRTHQIRVHAKHHGNTIVNDEKYATKRELSESADLIQRRMMLHAYSLKFRHPVTEEEVYIGVACNWKKITTAKTS